MVVWYLLLVMHNTTVAIPQVDRKQCIQNRELQNQPGNSIYRAVCVPGGQGVFLPPTSSSGDEDD